MLQTLTKPIYELLVPVMPNSQNILAKGTILEFDTASAAYKAYSSGVPCAILMEDVPAGSSLVYAKVAFEGTFFEDEIGTVSEDVKAALRNVKIYILNRQQVTR